MRSICCCVRSISQKNSETERLNQECSYCPGNSAEGNPFPIPVDEKFPRAHVWITGSHYGRWGKTCQENSADELRHLKSSSIKTPGVGQTTEINLRRRGDLPARSQERKMTWWKNQDTPSYRERKSWGSATQHDAKFFLSGWIDRVHHGEQAPFEKMYSKWPTQEKKI